VTRIGWTGSYFAEATCPAFRAITGFAQISARSSVEASHFTAAVRGSVSTFVDVFTLHSVVDHIHSLTIDLKSFESKQRFIQKRFFWSDISHLVSSYRMVRMVRTFKSREEGIDSTTNSSQIPSVSLPNWKESDYLESVGTSDHARQEENIGWNAFSRWSTADVDAMGPGVWATVH